MTGSGAIPAYSVAVANGNSAAQADNAIAGIL